MSEKPKIPRRRAEELTDDQWMLLAPLIPEPPRRPDGRGRPWRSCREVMNGVLWVLRTGAPWADLPARFPPYQTCHRRFQLWSRTGVLEQVLFVLAQHLLEQVLFVLAQHLKEHGGLDISECFIDATFAPAMPCLHPLKKGRKHLKKGRKHRQDQARQRHETHGSGRPLWSSSRRVHRQCVSA